MKLAKNGITGYLIDFNSERVWNFAISLLHIPFFVDTFYEVIEIFLSLSLVEYGVKMRIHVNIVSGFKWF